MIAGPRNRLGGDSIAWGFETGHLSRRPAQTVRLLVGLSSVLLAVLWLTGLSNTVTSRAAEPDLPKDLAKLGMSYRRDDLTQPVPNRVHLLRADLLSGKVRAAVVVAPDPDGDGPAEAALTNPLKLTEAAHTLAFVNTNPWDSFPDAQGQRNRRWHSGQAVDILGLAAAGGTLSSPPQRGYPSVWFDAAGRAHFDEPGRLDSVREGLAGFGWIVREGRPCVAPGGPRHPRTAIGIDKENRVLRLAVVDGRQPGFSEGMTLEELAQLLADDGCWSAINLDGGGSSAMGLRTADGKMRVVNSPADRLLGLKSVVRPIPVVLMITRIDAE